MSFFSKKFTNFLNSFLETNTKEENKATQTPEETNSNNELLETQKNNSQDEEKKEENQEEIRSETIPVHDTSDNGQIIEVNVERENTAGNNTAESMIETTDIETDTREEEHAQVEENLGNNQITDTNAYANENNPLDEKQAKSENTENKIAEMPIESTTDKTCGKNTQKEPMENVPAAQARMKPEDKLPNLLKEIDKETFKYEILQSEQPKNNRETDIAQKESFQTNKKREENHQGKKDEEKVKEEILQTIEKVKHNTPQPSDIEKLIEQREYLENLLKEKFTKRMTVMFTDLKGSTSIADAEGDIASRTIMKQHNDVLFPIIKKYDGVLVKTMGDGTLSYFEDAQKAVLAAVEAQIGFDRYNVEKKTKTLLLVSIGLHTGEGVVEENDIFGDVVNVASRIESASNPGEIYLSEDTYNALADKSEIYIRFIKSTTLKGKKGEHRLYKAFWDEKEIELDKFGAKEEEVAAKKRFPFVKVSMAVSIPFMITYLLMLGGVVPNPFITSTASKTERRSLSSDISEEGVKKALEHPVTIIFDSEE